MSPKKQPRKCVGGCGEAGGNKHFLGPICDDCLVKVKSGQRMTSRMVTCNPRPAKGDAK